VKHAFAKRDAVHSNLQVVHAASVQKRNILLNAINETISQIQQNVQAGISEAQRIIQRVGNQTASVIANVTAGLQTTATTIITQATRYPTCATAQNASVANIVSQAGMLLHQLCYSLVTLL
jgi:short-subunit dehydrogenase involved in D-alanine esterification of teichoic acids